LKSVFTFSLKDWKQFLTEKNEKPFRAKQILEWIYKKKFSSFDEMSNIPMGLREILKENFCISALKVLEKYDSKKDPGTRKILFQAEDSNWVESVLIPNTRDKFTICISSQAGCIFACDFCATGQNGFKRNLTLAEILSQVYKGSKGAYISNIVFMGMGEPFLNPAVFEALERFCGKDYFDFSNRGITVSTIGIPEGILKMAEFKQVKLAWSYHSSFEEKRKIIFPILSQKYSLKEIKKALIEYQKQTRKRVTLEFLVLKDFNDFPDEADELIKLAKELYFHLNLIPYNPHPFSQYQRPSAKDMERFKNYFSHTSMEVTIRNSKGSDIQGACGQLAAKKQD